MGRRRFVDIVSTRIDYPEYYKSKFTERSLNNLPTFTDILLLLNNKEFHNKGKIFELSLFTETNNEFVTGIIITTKDNDIPPIRNKRTKSYSSINMDIGKEGLAYANVFLYDKVRNILFFEVNKYGCFLNYLSEFILKSKYRNIDLSFPAIVRKDEYERMKKFDTYKKLVIELRKPEELIEDFCEEEDSILNNILRMNIEAGKMTNADIIRIEQTTLQKRLNSNGLDRNNTIGLIDLIRSKIIGKGKTQNIKTFKIEGYFTDESERIKPINLLADTFNEFFTLPSVGLHSDVQEKERKEEIEKLYKAILPELKKLVG